MFLTCLVLKLKNIHVEQETFCAKAGETKIRKRDLKEKARQETKTRERIDEKKLCNRIVSCCSFHEQKPRRKKKKKKIKKIKTRNRRKQKGKTSRKEEIK